MYMNADTTATVMCRDQPKATTVRMQSLKGLTHLIPLDFATVAKPQAHELMEPELESSCMVTCPHGGRQELSQQVHTFQHGHVEGTEQWPPFVQHLLGALCGEVPRRGRKSNQGIFECQTMRGRLDGHTYFY